MRLALYPTDLTDGEWMLVRPLLPPAKPGGRPRSSDRRSVLNAIFSVLRGGCSWRLLPRDFPPWSTVSDYLRKWRDAGVWEQINTALREQVRTRAGRQPTPSGAIIDSQSVKTTERGGPHGYDGAKKVSGRKRHLVVDTTGLLLRVVVHPANLQDRDGAKLVLAGMNATFPRIHQLWADQGYKGYTGKVKTWITETLGWEVTIVQHRSRARGRGASGCHTAPPATAPTGRRSGSPTSACPRHARSFAACCRGGGSLSARSPGSAGIDG